MKQASIQVHLQKRKKMSAIIYNVSIKVAWPIHDAWLQWMKETHIAAVMNTGCFSSYRLARLLEIDEEEGPTYSCQYTADSKEQYTLYIEKYSAAMRQDGLDKWGNQFIAFRTVMQVVN